MTLLIPILAAIIIGILLFRLYLGNQAKKLSEDLTLSTDIPTEVDQAFQGRSINESDKKGILTFLAAGIVDIAGRIAVSGIIPAAQAVFQEGL